MRIYSEKTNKEYKTVDECLAAEDAWDVEQKAKQEHIKQLAETRKDRAKAVEESYKNYMKLLNEFIKDYGSWHATFSSDDGLFKDFVKYAFTW